MVDEKTAFEIGVQHGELIGEFLVGMFVIYGGGSVAVGAMKTCRTIEFVAKTYKRLTPPAPQTLFEESVDAVFDAF